MSPVAQQRCQDVVRSRFEEAAGSQVSGRRATVWIGGERAEEKKVEERNRAFGGRPRFHCESYPSPPNAERAPRSSLVWGERVPFIEPFSPPPLHPPPPVARSLTHPRSPRPLHPRSRRPLQFQDAAECVERDALALEQLALDRLEARLRARTDLAARVDDALPGHGAPGRQGVQRVADLARAPRQARRCGDL